MCSGILADGPAQTAAARQCRIQPWCMDSRSLHTRYISTIVHEYCAVQKPSDSLHMCLCHRNAVALPQYVKAFARKGQALQGLRRHREAAATFEAGLQVNTCQMSSTLMGENESVKAGGQACIPILNDWASIARRRPPLRPACKWSIVDNCPLQTDENILREPLGKPASRSNRMIEVNHAGKMDPVTTRAGVYASSL